MKTVIICSLISAIAGPIAVLAGTGHLTTSTQQAGPIRLQDLTLDRIVRVVVPIPPSNTCTTQMPAGMGFAIREVGGVPMHVFVNHNVSSVRFKMDVNGQGKASILFPAAEEAVLRYVFDPPVIVRPLDVLTISFYGAGTCGAPIGFGTACDVSEMTIAGWFLLPGEA